MPIASGVSHAAPSGMVMAAAAPAPTALMPPDETAPHQQIDEVRSGGGYLSQSDLRVHFGLGKSEKVDVLEIRWPSGLVDSLKNVPADQVVYVQEGKGIVRTMKFGPAKK